MVRVTVDTRNGVAAEAEKALSIGVAVAVKVNGPRRDGFHGHIAVYGGVVAVALETHPGILILLTLN